MKKNIRYYVMMAANSFGDQPTPVECEMQNKFLQGENSKAD